IGDKICPASPHRRPTTLSNQSGSSTLRRKSARTKTARRWNAHSRKLHPSRPNSLVTDKSHIVAPNLDHFHSHANHKLNVAVGAGRLSEGVLCPHAISSN